MKLNCVLVFLFITVSLFSQQPVSIHLTEKDGVPDNEFYDIIEDNDGYIWLAADKGLFRFDGVNYEKILHPKQRGLSVFNLNKDANGTIWYINIAAQIFYIKDGQSVLFGDYKNEFKGDLPSTYITNDFIIFFTKSRLFIVNKTTKELVYNVEMNHKGLFQPFVDDSYLFYGIDTEIVKLDLNSLEQKETLKVNHNDVLYTQTSIITNYQKEDLLYFVKSKNKGVEFFTFSLDAKTNTEKLNSEFPLVNIIKVKKINNQLWFCTENGVFICEVENNTLKIKQHLFHSQFVTNVIIDKHANYWFTTLNNSLFVVPNFAIKTSNIVPENEKIRAMTLGNFNEVLINTTNYSFYRYNFSTRKKDSFNMVVKPRLHLSSFNSFANNYYAFTDLGIYVFDNSFKLVNTPPKGGTFKDIDYIDENLLVVAYRNSVNIEKSPLNKEIVKLYQKRVRGYSVYYDSILKLSYLATIDGLFTLDRSFNEQEITHNGKSIYINDIAQTKDGVIWCNSFKNGLYAIKNNKVIQHYTAKNGLLSNTNSLIRTKDNSVWVAGSNGLQFFDTKKNIFSNLTKNEGIVSYNYNGLEIIEDNIYVSTPEQLIYFNEKDVFKPYNTPEVFFTSISIDNKNQELKPNYTFDEKASNVVINYNSVGFKTSTSGQFQYRLLGLNNQWVNAKKGNRTVQYNNLTEGDYIFQIKNVASNEKESKLKAIKFFVTKPFWQKTWFFVSLFLSGILVVVLFFRKQIRKNEIEKNKLLEQLSVSNQLTNLKLENLRSQMNPHFVFNALNSIQDYIISNKKDLAGDYLGEFADLIRTYLEHSSKGEITLEEEVETLEKYLTLEKLRFEDTLEYTINVININNLDAIYLPTMLVQPYIENALKHGLLHKKNNRRLLVEFSKKAKDLIQCVIEDNGVGRKKSKDIKQKRLKQHQSFALKATSKRLDLLNKGKSHKISIQILDLYSETNEAQGTKVILQIPIKY